MPIQELGRDGGSIGSIAYQNLHIVNKSLYIAYKMEAGGSIGNIA